MTMKGMDIEAGRQSATQIQQGSSELEQLTNTLTQSLEGFQWIGPDADRTRQTWQSEHRTALTPDLAGAAGVLDPHQQPGPGAGAGLQLSARTDSR